MSAERKFHVHAVAYDDDDSGAITPEEDRLVVECPDDDPDRIDFGLYERLPDGRLEHISDHPTREEATAAGIALGMTNEDDQP